MLNEFIKAGDFVFDIGANTGEFANQVRSLGADVLCIEPQPHLVSVLEAKNFPVVAAACGDRHGHIELHCSDDDRFASAEAGWLEGHAGLWGWRSTHTITVPVITIETLILEYGEPDFMKIDTEGHEAAVISGLRYPVSALSLEVCGDVHPLNKHHSGRQALRLAHDLNPKYRYRLAEHSKRWATDWLDITEIEQSLQHFDWGDAYIISP